MKQINFIVVHSTGTETNKKAKDFYTEDKKPMYHHVIERDGEVVQLNYENYPTNTIEKNKDKTVHLAFIGGINQDGEPIDNRTQRQKEAMFYKLVELSDRFPNAEIVNAKDVGGKDSGFDVKEFLKNHEPDFSLDTEEYRMAA